MPGITPSRYVRGIPNPHSAYASAEIPENVTIFKNLSRWQTTAPTTISVSQFCHCHDLRANDIRCNSRVLCHPTKALTFHVPSPAFMSAQFLLAQIHTDPYTHECCECAVTWFITPQDYHSLPGAETRLFSDLSVFPLGTTVTPLSGLWLPATVYGASLQFGILCGN